MTPHNHEADFDQAFWQDHWRQRPDQHHQLEPNPYLRAETARLAPGTALDAGCGQGAEALWLAEQGWQVTAVDISETALEAARQQPHPEASSVAWVCADLTTWEPERRWDLVVTNYAHTPMPQLEFYTHIARWVAPGGTLLIVGHAHDEDPEGQHPAEATVQGGDIVELFVGPQWTVDSARHQTRQLGEHGTGKVLRDVVVRVRRNT